MAQTQTTSKTLSKTRYPSRYHVVIHNDDYTPMDFVIHLLVEIFNCNLQQAQDVTLSIHNDGKAVAGTYSFEIAEQKTHESNTISRHNGHPLKITCEEA